MRIKFEKLNTTNGKVYVNFGNGFEEYEISEVKDSGITIPEDCTDYSSIQIKGSSVILNNLDVISNIKTSDENSISSEDITGIVLKDFNGKFDKSLLQKYPNLKNLSIPEGVTYINRCAFKNCSSLTSITLPDSVTFIGSYAFEGCSSLTNVTISKSVTDISGSVFLDCTGLKSITIPNSVITIFDDAFYNCTSLTSITIPESVTSIGNLAFYGCSNLRTINYEGTEEQWNNITKSTDWNDGCPADMVINYNYVE